MESSTSTTTAATDNTSAVTFHSGASNLRVVRDQERFRYIGETNDRIKVDGRDYQFYDGVLVVADPDDIDWLRGYDSFGKLYFETGGAPAESSADLQREIMEKALAGDFDGVADILVAERSALSRPEVIASCEAALKAGDADLPPRPNTPLHELQRVRTGPAAGITPGVSPDPVGGTPLVDPATLEQPDAEPASAEDAIPPGQDPAIEAPASEEAADGEAEAPSGTVPNATSGLESAEPTYEPVPDDTPAEHEAADGDGGVPGPPA